MQNIVLHHPRKVMKEWIGRETGEPTRIMLCKESEYGRVRGMLYAERNGGPWSEPRATPIMHAWLKDNISTTEGYTIVFPQCGSAVTEVALLRLLVADGIFIRRAIFMDHVMELIDLEQFADLTDKFADLTDKFTDKFTDKTMDIHLFWRYKDLNEFLLSEKNLVVIGVHACMVGKNFPFEDYADFCTICGTSKTPYVNFRQLSYIEDFTTFTATSGERIIHEADGGPTVVVKCCSWEDERRDVLAMRC